MITGDNAETLQEYYFLNYYNIRNVDGQGYFPKISDRMTLNE